MLKYHDHLSFDDFGKNIPNFITAANKLYLPEDAKELDKLKFSELYEEMVVNYFTVTISTKRFNFACLKVLTCYLLFCRVGNLW